MSSLHIRSLGDATASLWTLNASQVLERTASLSPTPGGGAISVFTATLGLALVQKGASISLKRVGEDAERGAALTGLCEEITAALASIGGLADEDSLAFHDYVRARSLPRSTEGEKVSRDAAVETALLQATRVPLRSAERMCEALKYAEMAVKLADFHLLSDIFGGAILLEAASKAVLLNVGANVLLLKDLGMGAALEAERAEVERVAAERVAAVGRAYTARVADSKGLGGAITA